MDWRAHLTNIKHLYIHIPFCHRRCAYCDFNTYANMEDRMEAYVEALCAELNAMRPLSGRTQGSPLDPLRTQGSPLDPLRANTRFAPRPTQGEHKVRPYTRADLRPTIFLGGGTPSMLPLPLLERVLVAADAVVPLDAAEVTVEANPGTVLGRDYLRALRGLGVNRLSMGVQSLHDPTLKILGRIHTAAEARESYADARLAGFESINLDFIFGLPGQSLEQWDATLREILTWDVDHFSLYSLILEEKTPLYAQVLGGRVTVPDDDATAAMYELAIELFGAAGYVQYEISNWARRDERLEIGDSNDQSLIPNLQSLIPAHACHHNLAYWLNADYLAAGAGAHGHAFPRRYADVLGIDEYIERVRAGQPPIAETTELAAQDLWAETMFMGLRLNAGVGYAHFQDRCGVDMREVYRAELGELASLGLLECDEIGVRLTERGRMLGNQVFLRFV